MALPKEITFITFDVYGTLVDWETGIFEAFSKEAAKDGIEVNRNEFIPMFFEAHQEMIERSYELYAEVLRRTALAVAEQIGWDLEPSRSNFLPDSIGRWPIFKEAPDVLKRLGKKYSLGFVANIDDKLLGLTRRTLLADLDLVVTAQQVRAYKPEPAHFKECSRRVGGKKGWVHICAMHHYDVAPCVKSRIPVIWVNRSKEPLGGRKKPSAEVKNLKEAVKLLV